jgi:poly(A) polymerase
MAVIAAPDVCGMSAQIAKRVVARLRAAGFSAFWVGGCVRDMLLGKAPLDYDVVTSALPANIESLFRRTIPVGRKFGVMVVVLKGIQIQVATFRAEADYRDGRHPEQVTFGDERADVLRRDFTVNGLLYDPVRAEIHDWVGGEADIRDRVIRTIGVPEERFAEDRLRLMRAVRLAAQLNFKIAPETFGAVKANSHRITSISPERIRDELLKTFRAPHAARGLELLHESGLLKEVLPEIEATVNCEQSPEYHPEGTVFNHLVLMLSKLPSNASAALAWAVLLHDIGKPVTATRDETGIHFYEHEKVGAEMAASILQRLRFPGKEIEDIVQAVRCHMQFKDVLRMRRSTVRRMLLRPTFPLELELHRLDCLGSSGRLDSYDFLVREAEELERQPEIRPPLVTGDDLIGLGMRPGRELGAILSDTREKQLEGELRTREEALVWIKTRLERPKEGS